MLAKQKKARLVTIPFSHYCEKARWALDRTGVDYDEQGHLPGLHVGPMRAAGGRTVPLLVTSEGKTLTDSADIVLYADSRASVAEKLYPDDAGERAEVLAIEATCNRELGIATRLLVYHHSLGNRAALARLTSPAWSASQERALPWVLLAVRPLIRRRYRITARAAVDARESIQRVFDGLEKRLRARRWLVGDKFSAADLTFASLAAPVILPTGHPSLRSDLESVSATEMRDAVASLRETGAGQHVIRMYREERLRRPAPWQARA